MHGVRGEGWASTKAWSSMKDSSVMSYLLNIGL